MAYDNKILEALEKYREYYESLPYKVRLTDLYKTQDLFNKYIIGKPKTIDNCYDAKVYKHTKQVGLMYVIEEQEVMSRVFHDYGITKYLLQHLYKYPETKIVGIIGGHETLRTDESFSKCAMLTRSLARSGYVVISGGGPGAMESAHLGVYMSEYTKNDLEDAIKVLANSPSYKDKFWIDDAFKLRKKYKESKIAESISIPTWFYGHEPPTLFATHIAKYFDNATREDTLMLESFGGLIVMPGSAGTLQEIFQKNVVNHYNIMGYQSPIIFYGKDYWTNKMPIYPLLKNLYKKGLSKNKLITITDNEDEIFYTLRQFSLSQISTNDAHRKKYREYYNLDKLF